MHIRPSNGTIALTAGLAAAVLCGPFLLRGDSAERAQAEASRRQIADMTESERQRLEANFKRWQSLSAAEQNRWRNFHRQLQENGPALGPVLADYYDWLVTIPGYRREQLHDAPDISARVDLVHEIVGEQLADRLEAPALDATEFGGRFALLILSPSELDAVLEVVENHLSEADHSRLVDADGQPLTGLERHLKLLPVIGKKLGGPQSISPSSEVLQALIDALPSRVRDQVTDDRLQRAERRNRFVLIVLTSVRAELERAVRTSRPAPDKLEAFYSGLPLSEQERLLELAAADFTTELSRQYFQDQLLTRAQIDLNELRKVFPWQGPNREGGIINGDRPGGGFLPGDRMRPQFGGRPPLPFRDGEAPRPGEGRPPAIGDRPLPGNAPFPPGDAERPRDQNRPSLDGDRPAR